MNKELARECILQLRLGDAAHPGLVERFADVALRCGTLDRIESGTILFAEGDASDDTGIVLLEGEVSIDKESAPEFVVTAPDLMGEMAPQSPMKKRTATVTATTEVDVLRFSWSDFRDTGRALMDDESFAALEQAIQNVAWEHFTY